jgi:hypothetical protein
MATQITYADKETLNAQPSIAEKNKCTSGNMNEIKSVVNGNATELDTTTSNLSNMGSYSTTEVNTHQTWIDGKTIYRKVIDIGTLTNATAKTVNHNILNIDKIIYQYAIACDSNGMTYSIPHVASPNMSSNMTMALRSNKEWVQVYCSANMSSYTGYYILEYTKTTD